MMRAIRATLFAAALAAIVSGGGQHAGLAQQTAPVDLEVETVSGLDGTVSTPPNAKDAPQRITAALAITEAAFAAGFAGEMVVDMGGLLMVKAVSPDLASEGHGAIDAEPLLWPYASITKQILAATIAAELDAGGFSLDTPISEFVDGFDTGGAPAPTMRQLLQHRSGLRNPNDTPASADGWSEFYTTPGEYGLEWCLQQRSPPPAKGFSYNNCDYIVLGAAFDELSFEDWPYLLGSRDISNAVPFVITPQNASRLHKSGGREAAIIPAYGASGALGGSLEALAFLNWSRMQSYAADLEAGGARAAFWQGDRALGFMALGHWVFEVEHPLCDAPVTVSQQNGAIGRYQLENIMLPELGRSIVFATAKAPFEFGEIWAKSGPLYEAVGLLACGDLS